MERRPDALTALPRSLSLLADGAHAIAHTSLDAAKSILAHFYRATAQHGSHGGIVKYNHPYPAVGGLVSTQTAAVQSQHQMGLSAALSAAFPRPRSGRGPTRRRPGSQNKRAEATPPRHQALSPACQSVRSQCQRRGVRFTGGQSARASRFSQTSLPPGP